MEETEIVFLFKGVIMDENGEQILPMPRLFSNLEEAQIWIGQEYKVIPGRRQGDRIVERA